MEFHLLALSTAAMARWKARWHPNTNYLPTPMYSRMVVLLLPALSGSGSLVPSEPTVITAQMLEHDGPGTDSDGAGVTVSFAWRRQSAFLSCPR